MIELTTVLSVILLFVVRIGIPIAILMVLGVLVDRWQQKRAREEERYVGQH